MQPEEWRLRRALRLAMLLDAPDAFGGALQRELDLDDETWQSRARVPGFIAEERGRPLGMAVLHETEAADPTLGPEIGAMWVVPDARGRGLAGSLVDACLRRATEAGHRRVRIHVMSDNPAALAAYAKAGFRPTGRLGEDPRAQEWARDLGTSSG